MVRTSTGLESVVPQVFNFESYPIGYIIWIYYQRVIHIINGIIPLNGDLLTSLINRLPGRMILQVVNINSIPSQWPFQEPIHWRYLPIYIYKAHFSGLNFRKYPHNSYGLKNGTQLVPPFVGSWRSPIDIIMASLRRHRAESSGFIGRLGILK